MPKKKGKLKRFEVGWREGRRYHDLIGTVRAKNQKDAKRKAMKRIKVVYNPL